MFSSLSLFHKIACPERDHCTRPNCLFSHRADISPPPSLDIPEARAARSSPSKVIPAKRLADHSPSAGHGHPLNHTHAHTHAKSAHASSSHINSGPSTSSLTGEPPRKLQKTGPAQRPIAVPSASYTSTGVPLLKVNAAQSQVAVPVRQAMLKTLYEHFVVLYEAILPTDPTLAADHALRQEAEVYSKSSKLTYRNAVINSIAALKRRPVPDSASHPSVGTEGDIATRTETQKSLDKLRLTRTHLEDFILSMEDMRKWGYFVEIPEGPGGNEPSIEGKIATCERCNQPFQVKRREEADECIYHWGKPYTKKMNGEKMRIFSCCARPVATAEGCTHGPHVFYENKAEDLHSRYPFSFSRPPSTDSNETALDVVALDCEMIYTTGGSRVARVSVVDGSGTEIFDEFVRMDEGVEVIDYITQFSGITPELQATAVLPLASIRQSLDHFINANTIMIGHALDNDLKTLRIIHHQCVDTAILFPHRAGPPYRRALRDLVREHLGIMIQRGGAAGHSSVEDSIATLNLVRWHVLNAPKRQVPKQKAVEA